MSMSNQSHWRSKFQLTRRAKARRGRRQRTLPYEALEGRLMMASDLRDMLLADHATDSILRFDGETGAPLGPFVSSGAGGLVNPHNPTFGPDGNLYVFSTQPGAQKILEYDGQTGAFVGTFVDTGAGGFAGGFNMAFGPNGDLYVATGSASVLRYDGDTGAFVGIAATGSGITRASGVEFGPDGKLYVLDSDNAIDTAYDRILRFDADTAAFIDVIVQPGSLEDSISFAFGPDGHLYVPDNVLEQTRVFNGTTGELQQVFGIDGTPIESFMFDIVWGPDGNAYGPTAERIVRFEGETFEFLDTFVEGSGGSIVFFPAAGARTDLAVSQIEIPIGAVQGNDLAVTYTVTNDSASATTADEWVDVVYLSTDDVFDPTDQELGRRLRTTSLSGGASYTETLTAALPNLTLGNYHVFVVADRRGVVNEPNRSNNLQRAGNTIEIVPALSSSHDPAHSIAVGRTLSAYTTADITNDELTITYTVYNLTDGYAEGTLLTTMLAPNVSLVRASLPTDRSGQDIAWNMGTLAPFGRASVQLTVSLDAPSVTQIDNGPQAFATIDTVAVTDDLAATVLRTDAIDPSLLAATQDANSSDPFVQTKAAELNQDPTQIFQYLTRDIRFESYAGSLRGARGTLWSSAGNALDEASLGVALMRASGIPARYVQGTLSDPLAQELIASMFPEPFQVIGLLPDGTTLSDPANDPRLLSEARQHYWFQFDTGSGFDDADTAFADAVIGQIFTTANGTFAEVADELRHKVQITLDVETYSQASAAFAFGNGLGSKQALDYTFNSAELVGRMLTLGNFVGTRSLGGPSFTSIANNYSPYIQVSDAANPAPGQDQILRGIDFQELLTSFPLGSQVVTGLFLKVITRDPQADGQILVSTAEKTLFDRIGYVARKSGSTVSVTAPAELAAISPFDLHSLFVSPAPVPESVVLNWQSQLATLTDELSAQFAVPGGSANEADIAQLNLATHQVIVRSLGILGSAFLAASSELANNLQADTLTRLYLDSPRILALANTEARAGSTGQVVREIDILRNVARAIAAPGQSQMNEEVAHLARALLDKTLEGQIIGSDGTSGFSTVSVFREATAAGLPLIQISSANLTALDALPLSMEAEARITDAVLDGFEVIVPSGMVTLENGEPTIAWVQINRANGDWTFVDEHGGHGAIVDYGGVEVDIPDEIVAGQASVARSISVGREQALKIIQKIREAKIEMRKRQVEGGFNGFDWTGWGFKHITKELDAILPKDPTNLPLSVFRLAFLGSVSAAIFVDPPLPEYLRRPAEPDNFDEPVTGSVASPATLSSGVVSGAIDAKNLQAIGSLTAAWASSGVSQFSVANLQALQATVTNGQGAIVGSGPVNLAPSREIAISISGNASYLVNGSGSLSVYGHLEDHLGVSAEWSSYSADLTGGVTVTVEVPAGAMALNGQLLPAGKYTIETNVATLAGRGKTSTPTLTGSASIDATSAAILVGPSNGNITVDGQVVVAQDGVTLTGYTGDLSVAANGTNLADVTLNGSSAYVLALSTSPTTHTTDQNSPVTFQSLINTSFADTYELTAEVPERWTVAIASNGEITVTPAPGTQAGTHALRIFARSQTNPRLLAQTIVNVSVLPATADMALAVNPDPIFTIPFGILPFGGAQFPGAFQAEIRNLGLSADSFDLSFANVPAGFNVLNSVDRVTIPAGETGIVGVYLQPVSQIPPPGTQLQFDVTATSTTTATITRTVTVVFTVPEVHAVSVTTDPQSFNVPPGTQVTTNVTFASLGNVAEDVAILVQVSPGLSVAGPNQLLLNAGESATLPYQLTVDSGVSLNSNLYATFLARFADTENGELGDRVLVRVAAPGVGATSEAALAADDLSYPDLANRLKDLGIALAGLTQDPTSNLFKQQSLNALDAILRLIAIDQVLATLDDELAAARDALAAASLPTDVLAALSALGTVLDAFAERASTLARSNFDVVLMPNVQVAQPLVPKEFVVKLHNVGTDTSTYNLAVSGLPPEVASLFSETQVTLARDEFRDVTLTLTQTTTDELLAFDFTVDVSIDGVTPVITRSATGSLRTRNEVVSVTSVVVEPAFVDPDGAANVTARVLNAVNRERDVMVSFVVKNSLGDTVFTSGETAVSLGVVQSLVDVDLGEIDTTGLLKGEYTVTVSVSEAGLPVPGATRDGRLLIGSPVNAQLSATPDALPPGDSTVTNTLEISLGTANGGGSLELVGQLSIIDTGLRFGIAKRNDLLYISGLDGVHIVDVTPQTGPTKVGFESGRADSLTVVGDQLFTINEGPSTNSPAFARGTLNSYSLTTGALFPPTSPTDPFFRDNLIIDYQFVGGPLVIGNTLFANQLQFRFSGTNIIDTIGDVLAFDISNPFNLAQLDVLNNSYGTSVDGDIRSGSPFSVFGLVQAGTNVVYAASTTSTIVSDVTTAGTGLVRIVDVSNPANLVESGTLAIPGTTFVTAITVVGNRAYVVGTQGSWKDPFVTLDDPGPTGNIVLTTLDISTPSSPTILGQTTLNRAARGAGGLVSIGGDRFIFSSLGELTDTPRLYMADFADPNDVQLVQAVDLTDVPRTYTTDGQFLYLVDTAGLKIFTLSGTASVPVHAEVQIPNGTGVEVVDGSFNVAPTEIIDGVDFDTLVWDLNLTGATPTQTITWQSNVTSLQPGETRAVTLDSTVEFTFNTTPGAITLPPETVFAEQVLSLDPAKQTSRPGEAAVYTVTIENPSALEVAYDLAVVGIPQEWVDMESFVVVPAGGSVDVQLTLTSGPFTAVGDFSFVVQATTGDVTGSVEGMLSLVGDPLLAADFGVARGVFVELIPTSSTAGQGTNASYKVRVTNTGSASDQFVLFATGLPADFTILFDSGIFSVPPGVSNFREFNCVITPPVGATAADYAFEVFAASITDVSITGFAEGLLSVLDLGVAVDIVQTVGLPNSVLQMQVTNTGQATETFDLAVAAPAAVVATLETSSVTLGPGASQTVNITVGDIDFAFPGALSLVGVARSQTNNAVYDSDIADVSIAGIRKMTAAFEDTEVELPVPGPGSFMLLVENIGNLEDSYTVEIMSTTGPVTASLRGLAGNPTDSIPLFILPGLSTGAILLDSLLTSFGTGTVTLQVRSLTDDSIVAEATANISAEGTLVETTTNVVTTAGTTYGDLFTFEATVSAASGTPDGFVQFQIDGVDVGLPVALVGGVATFTTPTTLTVDQYTITAIYAETAGFTGSQGSTTLEVDPAELEITADNKVKVYGADLPPLTVSYDGFVNGEGPEDLDTLPTIGTTATGSSDVDTYPITASGAAGANYIITYVPGTLEVTRAELTITAENKTKRQNDPLPPLTARYDGLVNGDTPADLDTPPTLSTAATATSPSGDYPILVSNAADRNYDIRFVNGNLHVDPPAPTVGVDVRLSSTGSPSSVVAGKGTVTYTFTVKNIGTQNATNLRISLASILPTGVTTKSIAPPSGTSYQGTATSGTWKIPSLKKGASVTLCITLNVGSSTTPGVNVIQSTATATSADQALINTSNDATTQTTSVVTSADVAVTKHSAPSTVAAGATITYQVTITNHGPGTAQSVSLTDVLPSGTTFVSQVQNNGPSFVLSNTSTQVCNSIASLPSKASASFTIVVQVASSVGKNQKLVNSITLTTESSDPKSSNNVSTATTTVSKTSNRPPCQNPGSYPHAHLDVDADGLVAPADVLLLIDRVNRLGPHLLPTVSQGLPYFDCNGDGWLTLADVGMVLDFLRRGGSGLLSSFESSSHADAAHPAVESNSSPVVAFEPIAFGFTTSTEIDVELPASSGSSSVTLAAGVSTADVEAPVRQTQLRLQQLAFESRGITERRSNNYRSAHDEFFENIDELDWQDELL